jgi:hypothetical protein
LKRSSCIVPSGMGVSSISVCSGMSMLGMASGDTSMK